MLDLLAGQMSEMKTTQHQGRRKKEEEESVKLLFKTIGLNDGLLEPLHTQE